MLKSPLKESIVLLGQVWLTIFATNCFTLRKLNCSWRKKWRRVGGCPDMSGGGSADILFPLVHNPCLLPSLENLEKKMTRDLLFWTWINSILLQVYVYILQMNAFTVEAIYVNKEKKRDWSSQGWVQERVVFSSFTNKCIWIF